jgi:hypothetical protein
MDESGGGYPLCHALDRQIYNLPFFYIKKSMYDILIFYE